MHPPPILTDLLVFLVAAVFVVPLAGKLHFSPVIGYLAAGILVGPHGLGLVADEATLASLAEFGVVFMLFYIGLELSLARLWVMRRMVFGLGLAQVGVTSALIGAVALALGQPPEAALVIGGALALSSTAFVLQLLSERGEQMTRHGRNSLAILLFQDIAVLPLLVVIPLMAADSANLARTLLDTAVVATFALAAIIFAGRFLLQPFFRMVASTQSSELFAIATLVLVLGTGWITEHAGMSMTLGAFMAGLLVAETAYRHQIEADIRPFRGILLGLFFMSTGAAMDLPIIVERWPQLVALLAALLLLKGVVLFVLGRAFGLARPEAARLSATLAQGGEFAFIALTLAVSLGVVDAPVAQTLLAVVASSLLLTPGLCALGVAMSHQLAGPARDDDAALAQDAAQLDRHVVIAGYGRVGRTVARLCELEQVKWLALDTDHRRVDEARARRLPVYFGDTTRREVLDAAGLARARALVITLDSPIATSRALAAVRAHRRQLPVVVRAHDHAHAMQLRRLGATATVAEAAESSLQLGSLALTSAGSDPDRVNRHVASLREEASAIVSGLDLPPRETISKARRHPNREDDAELSAPR